MEKECTTSKSFQRLEQKPQQVVSSLNQSFWKSLKKEFFSNKVAMISVAIMLVIIVASLLAPLSPYDPNEVDVSQKLLEISTKHWFGTDDYGRDYFVRALYGGRVSLTIGFASVGVSVIFGTMVGVVCGYVGGKLDTIVMRFLDVFLALPGMLLMIVLNTILSPGLITLVIVLSMFSWAPVARVVRAETMTLKERDFVHASKNLGASPMRLIFVHIIPNIIGTVIVSASLGIANAILSESALSYLGLGVQLPHASWGSMLQGAQKHVLDAPELAMFPGFLILITVLTFNLLGDVLRSVLEPKGVK